MCNNCGINPCSCQQPNYSYNWFNTENYPCNPCSTTQVCKKRIPAKCTFYEGPNLANLGLTSPSNLEAIVLATDQVLGLLKDVQLLGTSTQNTVNVNILIALNNINARLNVLESSSHPAYVI